MTHLMILTAAWGAAMLGIYLVIYTLIKWRRAARACVDVKGATPKEEESHPGPPPPVAAGGGAAVVGTMAPPLFHVESQDDPTAPPGWLLYLWLPRGGAM